MPIINGRLNLKLAKIFLFDFDDTLVDYPQNEREALQKLIDEEGIEQEFDPILIDYKDINHKLWKQYEKHEVTVEDIRRIRFEKLKEKYNLPSEIEQLSERYLEYFRMTAKLTEGALALLELLKKERKTIVILTNGFTDTQEARIQNTGIDKYIDRLITSEQIGYAKPHNAMYEEVLNYYGESKESIIMVGDNLSSDILGANKLGIPTIHITNGKDHQYTQIKPDLAVSDLVELIDLIEV